MMKNIFGGTKPKEKEEDVNYVINYGFSREQAVQALNVCNQDKQRAVEYCWHQFQNSLQKQQNTQMNLKKNGGQGGGDLQNSEYLVSSYVLVQEQLQEEEQIKQALEESLKSNNNRNVGQQQNYQQQYQQQQQNTNFQQNQQLQQQMMANLETFIRYEPLNPDERQRENFYPVGLKNIGNTCYFNSLIQSYFYIPQFTEKILKNQLTNQVASSSIERERACKVLVTNLAYLFSKFVQTNRKYTEPSSVLRALVDDFGQAINFGDQKDIGEFNLNFLERVEEGLQERKLAQQDQLQAQEQQKNDDNSFGSQNSVQTMLNNVNNNILDGGNADVIRKSSMIDEDNNNGSLEKQKEDQQVQLINNTIQKLFFGKLINILKVDNKKRMKVFNKKVEKMGPVILDTNNYGTLLEAWQGMLIENIEDFNCREVAASFFSVETPNSAPQTKTECIKETWIYELPKVLLFSLNRVNYNVKQQKLVKNNKRFEFDKVIHVDKFMYENRSKDEELNVEVLKLREKQKQIREEIKRFKEFYKGLSLHEIMDVTKCFIESQSEDFCEINQNGTEEKKNENERDVRSPSQLGKFKLKSNEIKKAIEVIEVYQFGVQQQIKNLENQLSKIEHEINNVYGSMKQNPYYLHSIMVHEGDSEGGHYYAFIYDRKEFKWYKFDDYKVSEVTEDKVFETSFGGQSQKSCAYSLMYVNSEIAQQQNSLSIREFNQSLEQIIPQIFVKEIKSENYKFNEEVTRFQVDKIVKNICDLVKHRQDKLTQVINSNQFSPDMVNLNTFLIRRLNKLNIAKWLLISQSIKHMHPAQIDLELIQQDDLIYQKLIKFYPPNMLILDKASMEFLKKADATFKVFQKKSVIIKYVLLNLTEKAWVFALRAIHYYQSNIKDNDMKCVDANRAFVLYMCSQINKELIANNLNQAILNAYIVFYDTYQKIEESDPHYKQVIQNLENTLNQGRKLLSSDAQERINKLVQILKNRSSISIDTNYKITESAGLENLMKDLRKIEEQDMHVFIEGWTNDSLAAQYNLVYSMFSAKYKPWILLHSQIISQRRVLTIEEITKMELQQGIQFSVASNNMV